MCSNIYEDTDRMVTVKQPKEDRHSRNLGTTILLIFIFMFQFNQYPKYKIPEVVIRLFPTM